ncbi:hypothetical protein EW146_g9085 [Bondarzewia mesenterica]|uniref:NAD+ kinase n=1 Tax=Bondarzewia mesenterica TaxID=1095465 RepID=A0A4S4L9N3_9AGAM|nr:hypothetical protein EW146_g9085 [Bondarzewia mesenterica]
MRLPHRLGLVGVDGYRENVYDDDDANSISVCGFGFGGEMQMGLGVVWLWVFCFYYSRGVRVEVHMRFFNIHRRVKIHMRVHGGTRIRGALVSMSGIFDTEGSGSGGGRRWYMSMPSSPKWVRWSCVGTVEDGEMDAEAKITRRPPDADADTGADVETAGITIPATSPCADSPDTSPDEYSPSAQTSCEPTSPLPMPPPPPLGAEEQERRTILLVNKSRARPIMDALNAFLTHIRTAYPNVRVFHETGKGIPQPVEIWRPGQNVDLVITLGGDGTILHASSLFRVGAVPPVLSFSMGTLGFLLPFHVDDFAGALESVFRGRATVLHRMRISCAFFDRDGRKIGDDGQDWQLMNEVALHRGGSPHLVSVDAFVDGQHLTESVSDGLIVSTPTGSTAYSLSAGGPIVHPALSALVLTPICPRSLSFRPLVFPASAAITLRIDERSRADATVSMDGQVARVLSAGESVTVRASAYPIPCINRSSLASGTDGVRSSKKTVTAVEGEEEGRGEEDGEWGDDWVRDINSLLQYNATFRSKALLGRSQDRDRDRGGEQ